MKMPGRSRIMLLLAALALAPAFILPLWSIRLVAPQYNEGLGMYIGARDIWGHTPHDIQNINILNHYIGMKPVVPAEVDVLQVMPWVLLFLAGAAVATALIGRRWAVATWLVAFVALGAAGFYEFYSWNYDYGHNLSPDAPIKVPGMTYQPPIFGTSTLLNIRASSYPSWGTLFVTVSFALGLYALLSGWLSGAVQSLRERRRQTAVTRPLAARVSSAAVLIAAAGVIAACGAPAGAASADGARDALSRAASEEFAPDGVSCDYCDGVIPAERFGGQLTTTAGVTYRFMSVECLAGFVLSGRVTEKEVASISVVDYAHGERLIDARSALFVRSEQRRSPNGLNLLASDTEVVARNLHFFFGGSRLDWNGVLALVGKEWSL
jgi:copper chaperone NosL